MGYKEEWRVESKGENNVEEKQTQEEGMGDGEGGERN